MDTIDLIVQDVRDLKKDVKEDFKTVNDKIDVLLAFKWKVMGGSMFLSVFVTLLFQVLQLYFRK